MLIFIKILGLPTLVEGFNGRSFLLNQRVGKLCDFSDEVYIPFLRYFLSSPVIMEYYKAKGAGGLQINISKKDILSVGIPLPALKEQKRIVAILNQAFADIDRARDLTERNLKNARELFESYLQQVFSQRGEGWDKKEMSDVCEITSKLIDPKKNEFLDLPHIGAGNLVSMTGELVDVKTAREEELISGKFLFDTSMVLYSKIRPYLMKVCSPKFDGLCSADIYPLAPKEGVIDKRFLFYLLLTKDFTHYAIQGSGRAGMPKVNRTHLFNYSFYLPSFAQQQEYVKGISEVAKQAQKLEKIYQKKLCEIDELKKSLLQKAFCGELTQNEAAA